MSTPAMPTILKTKRSFRKLSTTVRTRWLFLFCVSLAPVVRSLFLVRFFSHGVLMSIFRVHPCLFASRALELMSAQFLPLILM